jgi:peroxiredoxin
LRVNVAWSVRRRFAVAPRRMGACLAIGGLLVASSGSARAQVASVPAEQSVKADKTEDAAAASLVGTRPPEWQATLWMNTPPMRLGDLRGKVVLVRWWTAGCPFCAASAPALRKLDKSYRARGVVVVGMYHHKDEGAFDPAVYRATAKKYGFDFPLAVDPDWRTLKSWLRGANTGFTSVTFLLDRSGVVRYVHPGGDILEGDPGYERIHQMIGELIARP